MASSSHASTSTFMPGSTCSSGFLNTSSSDADTAITSEDMVVSRHGKTAEDIENVNYTISEVYCFYSFTS